MFKDSASINMAYGILVSAPVPLGLIEFWGFETIDKPEAKSQSKAKAPKAPKRERGIWRLG